MKTLTLILALATTALAAPNRVQRVAAIGTNGSAVASITASDTSRHLIATAYYLDGGAGLTITDSSGGSNTWAKNTESSTGACGGYTYVYCVNQSITKIAASVTSVTASGAGASSKVVLIVEEVSGLLTTGSAIDRGAVNIAGVGSGLNTFSLATPAGQTTDYATCLVMDRLYQNDNLAITGAGWTGDANTQDGSLTWSFTSGWALPGTATATCSGTKSNTVAITVSVGTYKAAPTPPTVTCPSATTGTVGTAYSSAASVSGGTAPFTCAVQTGSAPTGLSFASGCTLSGTPTTTTGSPFSFTVRVTDNAALTGDSGTCTITISAAPPASARRRRIN